MVKTLLVACFVAMFALAPPAHKASADVTGAMDASVRCAVYSASLPTRLKAQIRECVLARAQATCKQRAANIDSSDWKGRAVLIEITRYAHRPIENSHKDWVAWYFYRCDLVPVGESFSTKPVWHRNSII